MKDAYVYCNWEYFGKALTILRKNRGYTKKYISDVLNISPSTVANHEFDRTYPDLWTIAKYCVLYKIELYEFFHIVAYTREESINPVITSDIRKLALQHMITN